MESLMTEGKAEPTPLLTVYFWDNSMFQVSLGISFDTLNNFISYPSNILQSFYYYMLLMTFSV